MQKENDILSPNVFDFTIFPLSDTEKVFKNAIGRNLRKLIVVYAIESSPKEDIDFLKKILNAVKIDLDNDILLLGLTADQNFSFGHLKTLCEIERIIVFGKTPKEAGINLVLTPYVKTETANCTFLFADTLQKIAAEKALKGKLWTALQQIFID